METRERPLGAELRPQVLKGRSVNPQPPADARAVRGIVRRVANGAVVENGLRAAVANTVIDRLSSDLQGIAAQRVNATVAQRAGWMAEAHHAHTASIDAAVKRRPDFRAHTTASVRQSMAPHDIAASTARSSARVQVKYNDRPARTLFEAADSKYGSQQLVVPADQLKETVRVGTRRGTDGLGRRDYPDAVKRLDDRVRLDGVESRPLTTAEARAMATDPAAAVAKVRRAELVRDVKAGAAVGAAVSGLVSAWHAAGAFDRGEVSGGEAVGRVARDTALGAVDGAAKTLVSAGVRAALVRGGARSLARTAAPIAVAVTAVDIVKDVGLAFTGEINGEELAKRTATNVVAGATGWAGAEAGAALGTAICPGLGTFVGGLLGAILGSWFGSKIVR